MFLYGILCKLILIRSQHLAFFNNTPLVGHVAQLDRASDSGSESRGFESLHARKSNFQSLIPIVLIPFGSSKKPLAFNGLSEIKGAATEMLQPGNSRLIISIALKTTIDMYFSC